MNLEDQLREVLRRQQPPEGFAARVLNQARQPQVPQPRFRLLWPAAAFAAMAVLALSFAMEYRSLEEQRAGQQTLEALRLVSEELNTARNKVLDQ